MPSGTVFTDSAGVTVATAESPAWTDDDAWRVVEPASLEIGASDGAPEYLLSDVAGAVRLDDGRIVVADRGSNELRFFAPDGTFQRSVGRVGDGPGEFRKLDFIGVSGDSIVTWDERLLRVQLFDRDGEFGRATKVESEWPMALPTRAIGMVGDRTLGIRFIDYGDEVPNGIVRWPHERIVTVDLDDGSLRSIRTVLGYEASVQARPDGGYRHGQYLFASGSEFAGRNGRLAVAVTDTFRVEVLDLGGAPRIVVERPDVAPPPTSSADLSAFVDTVVGLVFPEGSQADPDDIANFRRTRMNTPMAPTRPLMRSIVMDVDAYLWIEPFFGFGEPPPPYEVFRADGTWLGSLTLPAGLERGFHPLQAPYLEIGSDYVLGVWRDDLDVEYVRLYQLEKPGA